MAIHLPPRPIVPYIPHTRVAYRAGIEAGQRQLQGRRGEVDRPEVRVVGGEGADDGGGELGLAALEQRAGGGEEEGEFVGDAVGEGDVGDVVQGGHGGGVGEGDGAEVVGFGEAVAGGESGCWG